MAGPRRRAARSKAAHADEAVRVVATRGATASPPVPIHVDGAPRAAAGAARGRTSAAARRARTEPATTALLRALAAQELEPSHAIEIAPRATARAGARRGGAAK